MCGRGDITTGRVPRSQANLWQLTSQRTRGIRCDSGIARPCGFADDPARLCAFVRGDVGESRSQVAIVWGLSSQEARSRKSPAGLALLSTLTLQQRDAICYRVIAYAMRAADVIAAEL